MSANGVIERAWANGRDSFCLRIGEILDLEAKCKAGLGTIAGRLESGDWYVNDVREPIRLGLIGAGRNPVEAQEIMERHVCPPLKQFVFLAYEIVAASIVPPDGEQQPGKTQADRDHQESTSSSPMVDSPDTPSTTMEADSDGDREMSINLPSGSSSFISREGTQPSAGTPV